MSRNKWVPYQDVQQMRILHEEGYTPTEIAERFDRSYTTVYEIVTYKTHAKVFPPIKPIGAEDE